MEAFREPAIPGCNLGSRCGSLAVDELVQRQSIDRDALSSSSLSIDLDTLLHTLDALLKAPLAGFETPLVPLEGLGVPSSCLLPIGVNVNVSAIADGTGVLGRTARESNREP
jgi:hypothetical protein